MKDADHAIGVLNKGPPAMDLAKKSSRGKRRRLLGDLKWLYQVAELKWQWTLRNWFWLIILVNRACFARASHLPGPKFSDSRYPA
jgi:hypothetical protein